LDCILHLRKLNNSNITIDISCLYTIPRQSGLNFTVTRKHAQACAFCQNKCTCMPACKNERHRQPIFCWYVILLLFYAFHTTSTLHHASHSTPSCLWATTPTYRDVVVGCLLTFWVANCLINAQNQVGSI